MAHKCGKHSTLVIGAVWHPECIYMAVAILRELQVKGGIGSVSIPETLMTETGKERREMPRFEMRLPVEVKTGEGNARVMAVTRDVSARGVYILLGSELSQSSDIEFTLTLPPEVTMTKSIRVRCNGQVIRVTRHSDEEYGVAAAIHHYEFLSNSTGANA